ncbi:MAG: DMT family transporter [Alphaproteobacteria bacterium]|nr:DMT family transporter [Alphaproteobacteria bacterium]
MRACGPGLVSRLAVVMAAAGAVTLWGATAAVTKYAVAEIDSVMVGILRTALAALLTAPLALALQLKMPLAGTGPAWLAVSSIGGFVAFPVLFGFGIIYTTASHAALIMAALPIFSGLYAAAVNRRWPGGRWWLGVAIAFAGEFLLIHFRLGLVDGAADDAVLLGDALILLSCAASSFGYVAGARLAQLGAGSIATTFWGVTLAGLALLPVLAWRERYVDWDAVGWASWACVLYLALGATLVAYLLWYWALARGGVARVGLAQFIQPVIAVGLAAVLLGERVTFGLAAAAAVIVAGVVIAQRPPRVVPDMVAGRRPV